MSTKENNGYSSKCLHKTIGWLNIYLYKSFDLTHGCGYHCQIFDLKKLAIGYGFSKKNKFTAVRKAIKELKE
jgi:hypothetical protein